MLGAGGRLALRYLGTKVAGYSLSHMVFIWRVTESWHNPRFWHSPHKIALTSNAGCKFRGPESHPQFWTPRYKFKGCLSSGSIIYRKYSKNLLKAPYIQLICIIATGYKLEPAKREIRRANSGKVPNAQFTGMRYILKIKVWQYSEYC